MNEDVTKSVSMMKNVWGVPWRMYHKTRFELNLCWVNSCRVEIIWYNGYMCVFIIYQPWFGPGGFLVEDWIPFIVHSQTHGWWWRSGSRSLRITTNRNIRVLATRASTLSKLNIYPVLDILTALLEYTLHEDGSKIIWGSCHWHRI